MLIGFTCDIFILAKKKKIVVKSTLFCLFGPEQYEVGLNVVFYVQKTIAVVETVVPQPAIILCKS